MVVWLMERCEKSTCDGLHFELVSVFIKLSVSIVHSEYTNIVVSISIESESNVHTFTMTLNVHVVSKSLSSGKLECQPLQYSPTPQHQLLHLYMCMYVCHPHYVFSLNTQTSLQQAGLTNSPTTLYVIGNPKCIVVRSDFPPFFTPI